MPVDTVEPRRYSRAPHFAREHTSVDSQAYLNGAVERGERAPTEIRSDPKSNAA